MNANQLTVVGESSALSQLHDWLNQQVNQQKLGITLQCHDMPKLNHKSICQVVKSLQHQSLNNQQSTLPLLVVVKMTDAGLSLSLWQDGMQVALDWHKLQRRVVSAGRKSELLLKAIKANAGMHLLDATAGFGYDSLILASTGAKVTLIESHPVMAMLLMLEKQRMHQYKNWQALMERLHIVYANATDYLNRLNTQNDVSAVYLDPMFPNDSYDAKVSKHMQLLHSMVEPPTSEQEMKLLQTALQATSQANTQQARVVVKRPKNAPYLAGKVPFESWANDALRFDAYQA